jgi:hypothetical protein
MAEFAIPVTCYKHMTEEQALASDWDEIPSLTHHQQTLDFCQDLEQHLSRLEQLIARHLGVPATDVGLPDRSGWLWGSFNLCLPVGIGPTAGTVASAVLRVPLPHRSGEQHDPGHVDEKLRCEAATYVWLRENCPSLPIPRLLGIGFPGGQSVSPTDLPTSFEGVLIRTA